MTIPIEATAFGPDNSRYVLMLILGLQLGVMGVIPVFRIERLQKIRVWAGRLAAVSGYALIAIGAGLAASAIFASMKLAGAAPNIVQVTTTSLTRRQQLFRSRCVNCHGISGIGNVPVAASFNPPPANVQVHLPGHDDTEIFGFISNSIANTAMPVFASSIPEGARWDVIKYIRAFAFPTAIEPPQLVREFTITSSTGVSVTLSKLCGWTVLLFIGYTTCGNTCTTILTKLKDIRAAFIDRQEKMVFLFIKY